jgi:hypothetical protein
MLWARNMFLWHLTVPDVAHRLRLLTDSIS